jgi:hypothetical protein
MPKQTEHSQWGLLSSFRSQPDGIHYVMKHGWMGTNKRKTERVGLTVMMQACILAVFGSNRDWDTSYPFVIFFSDSRQMLG